MSHPITRREFLSAASITVASLALSKVLSAQPATTQFSKQRYKIAACDWMMLKRQKLGAFKLAKDCGMDGVEVDMGGETALDAEGDKKLLYDVGSPTIRIYFNFTNAVQNNRHLYSELKILGKENICQIHCTDQDSVLLADDPKIDMRNAKETLDEM